MKLKHSLLVGALTCLLGVGAAVGLGAEKEEVLVKAEEEEVKTYYIVGTMNSWDTSSTAYPIQNDGSYYFLEADENNDIKFKIVVTSGSWTGALSYDQVDSFPDEYRFYTDGDRNICIDPKTNNWKAGVYGIQIVDEKINIKIAWEYAGSAAAKSYGGATWTGSLTHYLVDGGPSATWSFTATESFKLTDRLLTFGEQYNATLDGTAKSFFSGGYENSTNNNIVCGTTGDYALTLAGGKLYIDYADNANFYYKGSDSTKQGSAWTPWKDSAHTIKANGNAVEFSFNQGEEFGLVDDSNNWFGASKVGDFYYDCFKAEGDNIYVKMAYASYAVAVRVQNHALSIVLSATNQQSSTAYVLDLNGNLLNTTHNAHYFFYDSGSASTCGTNWPGVEMTSTASTNNIYQFTYWNVFTTVIFNDGTTQTVDETLAGNAGKCLVLEWAYSDGKWTSSKWLSLDAAKFIDSYMKFETAHEDAGDGTGKCKSEGWYSAAKEAYEDLDPAVQAEISGYATVANRLSDWARANNSAFVISDGVGSFSAATAPFGLDIQDPNNQAIMITVIISMVALASVGTFFLIKKRKEDK